jgi:hypothetical protein
LDGEQNILVVLTVDDVAVPDITVTTVGIELEMEVCCRGVYR